MDCENCGAENATGARFCLNCGCALAAHCPRCSSELPAGARFCPSCGLATPTSTSSESTAASRFSGGERKQVTVLFADFSGFTSFSEALDAEELRDRMVSIWARLDGILGAHGGTIEKHIGDALMAVFGARQAREEDPEQAVRAALEMQAWLEKTRAADARLPLQMRIGIHTGLVVLGPLGNTGEFAATGDTVNVASRLEQSAPAGGVLISHDTYRHVYGLFDVQSLPPLAVKGKPEPLQTYLVLRARPRSLARTLRGVEGASTKMIGREPELERLQATLQSVIEERELYVVTIVGDAGIGKSRLLYEFQKWVELRPEPIRLFYGRATAEMEGLPFALIRDVFASRFEIQENDPPPVAREKLEKGVVSLLQAAADARADSTQEHLLEAQFIGQLLGLDFSASPHLHDLLNDAEQIRHRAFHYLGRFFTSVSKGANAATPATTATRGALLIVEDIHSSDDGSLDLLNHLARNCQGAPLMILCLARPSLFERRPAWGEGLPSHTRMNLEPLSRRDSRTMVEIILRKALEIPQALRELIVGGAEGNPFYIEEIIKMLIDRKVIVPEAAQWRIEAAGLATARVPATLTGVLQARLDGLAPLERAVLQRASVIGRVFWDSAVERLSGAGMSREVAAPAAASRSSTSAPLEGTLSKHEIVEALSALRHKQLIFRREFSAFAGATEYTFKHELLRNVAYESVLKKLRRDYHARVASWLIDQSGERVAEFAGLVAAHFEQAGRIAEAADWFGRAGQQARLGYVPATAIEFFHKALDLLPAARPEKETQTKRMEWQEGLGDTLGAQARFAEALDAYRQMRSLAEARGDNVAQARAWNGLAFLHERLGENRASVESAEKAESLAYHVGQPGDTERTKALYFKAWALYRLGDAAAVLALAQQTLDLYTARSDRRGMITSLKLFGVAHLHLGHFAEADRYFGEALALAQELGDRRNSGAMWSNLGESARLRGDYQAASDHYQKALAIVRQIGHRDSESIYLNNLSGAMLGLNQFQQAETILRQIISQTAAPKSCTLSETYRFLGEACLGQEKLSEALAAAQHALKLAQESENGLDVGGAWRVLGRLISRVKESVPDNSATMGATPLPAPIECLRESLRVFEAMNAEGEQARTLRAWGEYELELGQFDEGRKKIERAREMFVRLNMPLEAGATQLELEKSVQSK